MRIFIGLAAVLVLIVAGSAWVGWNWLANLKASSDQNTVYFMVMPGDNVPRIAIRLEKAGLIQSERSLRWYAKVAGLEGKIRLGEYALKPNMSNSEIMGKIISGKSVTHKFTIPEGHNRFQIATALAEKKLGDRERFLKLTKDRKFIDSLKIKTLEGTDRKLPNLEGYLYPDTYYISRIMSEEEIIRMMVRHFNSVYSELEAKFQSSEAVSEANLTPHELVVLASVVEKETGAAFERPLIASVFYNRLRKRMRLQSDPTTIYGMWNRDGFFNGNIRRSDLRERTPYNTYAISRLPLGPIANPGKNALEAVIAPKPSDYLFFVSRNDGTHVFTRNYRDHSAAVNRLQKNPNARRGKSWRDLPDQYRVKN